MEVGWDWLKEDRFIGRFVRVCEHLEEVTDILEIEERLQLVAWVHFEFIPKGGCSDSESSTALFCMYVCIFVGMHYLVQLVMVSVPLGL